MKGLKSIIVLLLFAMFFSVAFAQVEEYPRVTDNGGGQSYTTSTINLASIGQAVSSTVNNSTITNQAGFITAVYGATVDIEEVTQKIKPEIFVLKQNYPNPFNACTRIDFKVPEDMEVEFCVTNVLGEVVMKLHETKLAGSYAITFDSGELPSGIYFYSLKTDNYYDRKQMMIMK